jgi:serine phosphatase RsbU (regulator of sigma subunit)
MSASGTAESLIQHILADLNHFYTGTPQHDDITMLAVKFPRETG